MGRAVKRRVARSWGAKSWLLLALVSAMVFAIPYTLLAEEKPWEKIRWNEPVPWPERLTGIELADEIPQEFIAVEPWLAQLPKKPVAVGGYIWPEGWEEAIKGVKTLTFFNYGGLLHDPAIGLAIAAFEVKTGIDIVAQEMEEIGVWLKTVASMVARRGEPQLIHNFPTISLNHIVAAGWAENLDFFWPPEVQALYSDAMIGSAKVGDHFWASGQVSVKPFALFYRPSLLEEATGSPEPPKTFQELLVKAKQVAERTGKYGLAIPGKDYRYMWYMFASPLYSLGGNFVNNGRFDVTSPEYKQVFTYMVNLVREGAVPKEALGWSWTDAPEVFERGQAAMLLAGTVNITRWTDNPPEAIAGDWDVVPPLPWDEGYPRASAAGPSPNWAVNKYASDAEKAAAMLFLDLYRSYQSQWNELGFEGNESAVPALYDMENIQELVSRYDVRRVAIESTRVETLPVNGDQMLQFQLEWWARAALGEVSIDEALQGLQEDIEMVSP